MAAATVNIPAIALSVGPMLNGWHKGERPGPVRSCGKPARCLPPGDRRRGFIKSWSPRRRPLAIATRWAPHTTMNSLSEAWGCSYRSRGDPGAPIEIGRKPLIVRVADRRDGVGPKPSDILTREAFINAIVVSSAIGGSTNAPIHLTASRVTRASSCRSMTGRPTDSRFRCSSICSPPANTSEKTTIAPVACPP